MPITDTMSMTVGPYRVDATSNGGHPPEFWADYLVGRLIVISDSAPPEIKLQAIAYHDAIKAVILDTMNRAILSNHTTVIHQLRKAGMDEAAQLVWELNRR